MADNIAVTAGSGTTLASDDIGGVQYPRIKISWGADGAAVDASAAAPFPVVQTGTPALPTGAATETTLAAVKTAVELIDNAISGSEMQVDIVAPLPAGTNNIGDVDVLSCALPTGASTAANQSTIIGHLDGVEGLLTTIDADTGSLAGCVAGAELQVDVVSSALPTGASTSANQSTIIGHLDGVEGLLTTIDADTGSLDTKIPAQGQAVMAASLPVVIASNQSAVKTTHGQTLKSVTGSASATFTIVAAVASNKIKVYSLSLMTASTTAVTVTFKDGAAGTAKATYILQAITGTNFGVTENLAAPSTLFETSVNTLLEMSFSSAQTVVYNLRYFEEA